VREYAHAYPALSPWDDGPDSLILPEANTGYISVFLKESATRHPREFIVIGLGRIRVAPAKALKVPANMALPRLPPCFPELNPVEKPWGEPREKHFHHRLFHSLDAVENQSCDVLASFEPDCKGIHRLAAWPRSVELNSNAK
jgi:hypothetical protein